MGKFFTDLPVVPSLTDDTLFAVSDDTTIKTYKTTLADIGGYIGSVSSGAEARMSSQFDVTTGIGYVLPFDTIRYDIEGSEFDTSTFSFEPINTGLYLITVTAILAGGSFPWTGGDQATLFIFTGDVTTGITWNSVFYKFPNSTAGTEIISCTGVVRVTSVAGLQIRGGVVASFSGGGTRSVIPSVIITGTTTAYSNIQVSRVQG